MKRLIKRLLDLVLGTSPPAILRLDGGPQNARHICYVSSDALNRTQAHAAGFDLGIEVVNETSIEAVSEQAEAVCYDLDHLFCDERAELIGLLTTHVPLQPTAVHTRAVNMDDILVAMRSRGVDVFTDLRPIAALKSLAAATVYKLVS